MLGVLNCLNFSPSFDSMEGRQLRYAAVKLALQKHFYEACFGDLSGSYDRQMSLV
jgi:hypothetical protein